MRSPVGGIGGRDELRVETSLEIWAESTATGVAFGSNTGFNLPNGCCLSPAAAWVSLARWNALTPDEQAGYPPLCPEFIIEVRSRTDSRHTLESKMELWLDNGAQLAWLVDPVDANVSIYLPKAAPVTLDRPSTVNATQPLEGFTLDTDRLWPKS